MRIRTGRNPQPIDREVRRARAAEAEEAAGVIIRLRTANIDSIPAMAHDPDEVVDWFTHHVMASQDVWVAVSDGQIIATMVLAPGWLEQLYVLPAFVGIGIGTQLVDLAKSEHPSGLQLWTFASNQRAVAFYERLGFVEQERTDGDNEESAADIRFHWKPSPSPGS